jgi:hypothetical protein
MSWSLSTKAAKAQARDVFLNAHHAQPAYQTDGSHKAVMDAIAAFAALIAEGAPDGSETSLTSSGHVGTDGTGSLTVSLSFFKPFVPT